MREDSSKNAQIREQMDQNPGKRTPLFENLKNVFKEEEHGVIIISWDTNHWEFPFTRRKVNSSFLSSRKKHRTVRDFGVL